MEQEVAGHTRDLTRGEARLVRWMIDHASELEQNEDTRNSFIEKRCKLAGMVSDNNKDEIIFVRFERGEIHEVNDPQEPNLCLKAGFYEELPSPTGKVLFKWAKAVFK